jgi:tRNA U38,U39,U40 pseudouridine synthase TruA
MRHMMNLETVNTYEGTHDIHAFDTWESTDRYLRVLTSIHNGRVLSAPASIDYALR